MLFSCFTACVDLELIYNYPRDEVNEHVMSTSLCKLVKGGKKRCPEINKNQLIELRRTLLDLDLDVQVCEMGFCIDEYSNSLTPTLPQNLL